MCIFLWILNCQLNFERIPLEFTNESSDKWRIHNIIPTKSIEFHLRKKNHLNSKSDLFTTIKKNLYNCLCGILKSFQKSMNVTVCFKSLKQTNIQKKKLKNYPNLMREWETFRWSETAKVGFTAFNSTIQLKTVRESIRTYC